MPRAEQPCVLFYTQIGIDRLGKFKILLNCQKAAVWEPNVRRAVDFEVVLPYNVVGNFECLFFCWGKALEDSVAPLRQRYFPVGDRNSSHFISFHLHYNIVLMGVNMISRNQIDLVRESIYSGVPLDVAFMAAGVPFDDAQTFSVDLLRLAAWRKNQPDTPCPIDNQEYLELLEYFVTVVSQAYAEFLAKYYQSLFDAALGGKANAAQQFHVRRFGGEDVIPPTDLMAVIAAKVSLDNLSDEELEAIASLEESEEAEEDAQQ